MSAMLFMTFWHVGGETVFREGPGNVIPIPLAMTPELIRAIRWEAVTNRGVKRARLNVILQELIIAREDTIRWRMAETQRATA